ncbi:hypothetical protein OG723_16485 [Streptomyces sp. NBC_01278]|uniref:hypothetical protein n=1 Tax=Streptomyces sp. NBC_01278 TaxID=2903809 RepID=UPI002E343880|nr:hypothetical protein [Streptomyces sp. NBC_01278]
MDQLNEFGDPRDFIRRQQHRFFRKSVYDSRDMAGQITAEAVLAGATEVRVAIDSEWVTIESDVDWLEGCAEDAFSYLTPFPPGGATDTTREILAVTFSLGVVTATTCGIRVIKGDSTGPVTETPKNGRVVAFRTAFE